MGLSDLWSDLLSTLSFSEVHAEAPAEEEEDTPAEEGKEKEEEAEEGGEVEEDAEEEEEEEEVEDIKPKLEEGELHLFVYCGWRPNGCRIVEERNES
jgi:ubiquinol-cytochrome c reductase subunit 6